MAILFATLAAACYGLSDFVGGVLSRRASPWSVAVAGQFGSVIFTSLVALAMPGDPTAGDFAWAGLAGVGGGTGTAFLYRGLGSGRMSVVAPISAVTAALVPVIAGLAGGERPALLAWIGIAVGLPGIWLVSSEPSDSTGAEGSASSNSGVVDGLLAGLGFGLMFATIGQVPDESGMWPLALAQGSSVLSALGLALIIRADWVPRSRVGWLALIAGPIGGMGALLFLLAAQRGYLSISGVIASLYPAATILLAATLLRERIHAIQGLGLALCAAAVSLVALG
ncbi:MAG: DMT family transporter [Nocardioidaceae bacterium]|nr:MAG: DMT family transporter [Nocardioidaceae bacterium]